MTRQAFTIMNNTETQTTATVDLASNRFLNETAIRQHALACSQQFRAGRFTRVGEDFINEVKADVEALIRGINRECVLHPPLSHGSSFVTGALKERAAEVLENVIAAIIQNKVQRQPSIGQTLKATR